MSKGADDLQLLEIVEKSPSGSTNSQR